MLARGQLANRAPMTMERVEEIFDGISDKEWKIIEERAARRDLATDEEVERLFSRYRDA